MTDPAVPSFGESVRLPKTPRAPRWSRAQIIVGFYIALGLLALCIGWLRGAPNLFVHAARPSHPWLSFAIGTLLGIAAVLLSRALVVRYAWARTLHREFRSVVVGLQPFEIWLLAASSSVAEELFFRGALVPWCGVILSSIFFAALHVRADRRFLPWTAMSLIVGLMLGQLFVESGHLSGPIVAHFLINLLNLRFIARTELAE